jgi:hypothetical protein
MRTLVSLASVSLMLGASISLAPPAFAHGDKEEREEMRLEGLAQVDGTPVLSDNVQHLANIPGQVGISGCFMQTDELFVTSGLDSLRVYDVSDGTNPTQVGVLDNAVFENEAMNCGERKVDGERIRFALIGVDLHQASSGDFEHVNTGDGQELMLVDVTDPTSPTIISRTKATTSTHTVTCVVDRNCRYAYSAGDSGDGTFSVFDLRNPLKPREVDFNPDKKGLQSFKSPTAAHKWNFDSAGTATHTGFDGASIWDVRKQARPRLITTTGRAGKGTHPDYPGYNDFILHNSGRPNADAFQPNSKPSFRNGNIMLATEEDYVERDCTVAGSFQTWHVKALNPKRGTAIEPLDKVELSDLQAEQPTSVPKPTDTICSSHWFDHRAGGIVAVGFYGGGTQFIDVSNPKDIKSYGYAYWGGTQVWDTRWVPIYRDGKQVQRKSNVAYSIDLVRGLDVYVVDVGDGRGLQPSEGLSPERSKADRASGAVLPLGLVGGALALAFAVRRRTRTA